MIYTMIHHNSFEGYDNYDPLSRLCSDYQISLEKKIQVNNKKTDCKWNRQEVRQYLISLLEGNKPMLSAGSDETAGTFTQAIIEKNVPILSFLKYKKNLNGKQLSK